MHNYFCDQCGCSLDPGEICECRRDPEPEHKFVTYADWEAAGDFMKAAHPGDFVEERIVEEFLNSVPPASHRAGYIQSGEPYSHREDPRSGRFRATYPTFQKEGYNWIYRGCCFLGNTTEPQHIKREEN